MSHIFDIISHILLIKKFNILKSIFFNEINAGKKLNAYIEDKKININDENLMKEIGEDLNKKTCEIVTKTY